MTGSAARPIDKLRILRAAGGSSIFVVLGADAFLTETKRSLLAVALADWVAHVATFSGALGAYERLGGDAGHGGDVRAAFVASVAPDIDHVPGCLSRSLRLDGRPRTHGMAAGALIGLAAVALPNRQRRLSWIAFGLVTHLLRDLATGPGLSRWPFGDGSVTIPYPWYRAFVATVSCISLSLEPKKRTSPSARLAAFGKRFPLLRRDCGG